MASSNQYPLYKSFSTITVSVPNDSAIHSVYALTSAIDPQAPIRGKFVNIQNDPLTSTANCFLGEGPKTDQGDNNPAVVSATNHTTILQGASENFGGFWDSYNQVTRWYVINDGTGTGVLNLTVQVARG